MHLLALRRRDPWWGLEGPAARRRHQRERILSFLAFVSSIFAIAGAGVAWSIHLGFAAMLGFHLHLVIGLIRAPGHRAHHAGDRLARISSSSKEDRCGP